MDYYAYSGSYGGTDISGYSSTINAKIYNQKGVAKKTCDTLTLTKNNNSKLKTGTTVASNCKMKVTVNVKGLGVSKSFTVSQ